MRPWNYANTKKRENGEYYEKMFKAAFESHAEFLSITSFNEWHEGTSLCQVFINCSNNDMVSGTQIEPASPMTNTKTKKKYLDYRPATPSFYLELTRKAILKRFSTSV